MVSSPIVIILKQWNICKAYLFQYAFSWFSYASERRFTCLWIYIHLFCLLNYIEIFIMKFRLQLACALRVKEKELKWKREVVEKKGDRDEEKTEWNKEKGWESKS